MLDQSSLWERKRDFENFSKKAIRSESFSRLARDNKSYRHVLRFVLHVILLTLFTSLMVEAYSWNGYLALLLYPVFLFFQGLLIAGIMIHSHELSHGHIRTKWLNDLLGILSGAASLINFYSFQHAHRIHHRNIGNLDEPEAGAPVSLKGQAKIKHDDKLKIIMTRVFDVSGVLGVLSSWPLFVVYGDYSSWLLPFRRAKNWDKKSVAVFIFFVVIHSVLLWQFSIAYLLLFFIPSLLGGNRILAVTYMHHAHEDSVFFAEEHHNFYNVIMSTTDRDFGPIVNFFMLNNGYHIPHHLNPKIAYYDLKKASACLREMLPPHLSYNYYPKCSFYRDFVSGFYEQRLDDNYEYYQLKFLNSESKELSVSKQGVLA